VYISSGDEHIHSFIYSRCNHAVTQCMMHRWLEEELARRYRDAAPATLALLQERCEGVAAELVAAESRLQAAEDVTSLRRAGDQPCSLM